MSQSSESSSREDVQNPMLDANEALKTGDYQTALSKLKEAQRRCGVLAREGDSDE